MLIGGYLVYLLLSLPALLLGVWAQSRVRSAYKKHAQISTINGLTGAQVARRILDASGLNNVKIEPVRGFMSDHYDPRMKTLRLSPNVYQHNSVTATGIAAHEAGHALQHQQGYLPLQLRTAMVPSVQIGSWLGPVIFFLGVLMPPGINLLVGGLGLFLFGATLIFALVTLPVEYDASRRAQQLLVSQDLVSPQEIRGVDNVLDAAALTYVAAVIQALSTLFYYAFLLVGGRRD